MYFLTTNWPTEMKKLTIIFLFLLSPFSIHSQPYFQKVTTGQIATDITSSGQCAWGDYNGDGFIDLVVVPWNDVCWPCSYPILLYKNNGDGTFSRDINAIGQQVIYGNGAAWGDYDNDGKLDLIITRKLNSTNLLFHNEGGGQFSLVTTGIVVNDPGNNFGCAWADYDRDGWIDLFIARDGNQNNVLYHNSHDGTFTKVTVGPIVNDGGSSQGCAWGDYDNDGWPDLYVVNYSNQVNFLYHNNGNGTFTRIYNGPEVNTTGYGTSCAWADYDNDGLFDLFVTYRGGYNQLYHNDGNGNFSLSGTMPSLEYGWSDMPNWADFDNDGWIDLFVPRRSNTNCLYKNVNGIGFTRVLNDVVGLEGGYCDAGIWGDFNNDGKIDLFVTNGSNTQLMQNYFYRNVTQTGNYLEVRLTGCTLNKSAIGAKVKIVKNNYKAYRVVEGGNTSQNMQWPHFGLGTFTAVDSLIVYWTTGTITTMTNVNCNQILEVNECPNAIISNQTPVKYELRQNFPNPFNPNTRIQYSLMKPSFVKLPVFDITGKLIRVLVNENESAGTYDCSFDGTDLASGIYIYRIETEEFSDMKKMILVK